MKIQFEMSNVQLAHINEMIADNMPSLQKIPLKEQKATYYLISELANKLLKKAIDTRHTTKKFKITFKYYEAFTIRQFLLWYIEDSNTENRRMTREVLAILDPKL